MGLDEIKALPVPELAADNAHLYLWATASFLPQAFEVVGAWGFRYVTTLVWVKRTQAGGLAFGTGHYFRRCVEYVLFAIRGRLSLRVRDQRDIFFAPRRQHSQKPREFFNIVERCSPGAYLELLARNLRHGWTVWANEVSPVDETSLMVAEILSGEISLSQRSIRMGAFSSAESLPTYPANTRRRELKEVTYRREGLVVPMEGSGKLGGELC